MKTTDLPASWRYPAEWEAHRGVWLAWPWHRDLWEENLPAAQKEFVRLVEIISRGESIRLICHNESARLEAQKALSHLKSNFNLDFHLVPYGDIWVRDTGSLFFVDTKTSRVCAKTFGFNGWGEKYLFDEDPHIAGQMAALEGAHEVQNSKWILEGGALEWDGEGTLLTTRECLMNNNRKNVLREDQAALETHLRAELGVASVAWVNEGLLNDHTDGHIDTIARFIAPGVVVCMEAANRSDPHRDRLKNILSDLKNARDARGRRFEIFTVPSPGAVNDEEGEVMPASYMNFYIGNGLVAVPTYQSSQDDRALRALEPLFKGRDVHGASSLAILSGGGSFHCITQQVPKEQL